MFDVATFEILESLKSSTQPKIDRGIFFWKNLLIKSQNVTKVIKPKALIVYKIEDPSNPTLTVVLMKT